MTKARLPLLATLLTAALWTAPAAALAGVTEFPGLSAAPADLTTASDGSLWFTQPGSPGAIGTMAADGEVTEYAVGGMPAHIVEGPDGALWFTEQGVDGLGAIGRLDPATGLATHFTLGLAPGSEPTGITAGPDGNLWFTERAASAIGRITPAGVITEYTAGLTSGSEPTDITAGPDGKLWFTERADPGRIGRIDPTTGIITEFSQELTPNSAPTSIVASSSGKLYFTLGTGGIGRIKTDGKIEQYPAGATTAGAQPAGIAQGGDGAIWFSSATAPGSLGRMWPDDLTTTEILGGLHFTADRSPAGITRGADGNVWFAQGTVPGHLARVTVPPLAEIETPEPAASGRVRLLARIRPNSQPTTYAFEYGPTNTLGSGTAVESAGAGADAQSVAAEVDLARDARYFVRVRAENVSGEVFSSVKQFYVTVDGQIVKEKPLREDRIDGTSVIVVPPVIAPVTTLGPGLLPAAPPELGETVGVRTLSGTVRVKAPGETRYTPLIAGASIVVGSLVDTRRGTVRLRSARNTAGRVQNGTFWGSIFKVRQRKSAKGMTDLVLRGGSFRSCRSTMASVSAVPRENTRRRVRRRLWGRDHSARFRTHGRDSVATVRGTEWSTTDRCDGTVTRVKRGKVAVRDLGRKRTVLVTAGHSYRARHRR